VRQDAVIAVPSSKPLISAETWTWLCRHTGFPARRLEGPAELLVLLAAAAAGELTAAGAGSSRVVRQDARQAASQRQQAENRRKSHFKSNNRTKV